MRVEILNCSVCNCVYFNRLPLKYEVSLSDEISASNEPLTHSNYATTRAYDGPSFGYVIGYV